MSRFGGRRGKFVKMFSSAVVNQALLSAASLLASLILIRHTNDRQYGYYVLVIAAMLLLSSLQNAFYQPAMVARMTRFDAHQRAELIGGLYREQRTAWIVVAAVAMSSVGAIWSFGLLDHDTGPISLLAILVGLMVLRREFFRTVLLAYHRAHDVLKADIGYVLPLVVGTVLATLSPMPAAMAVIALGLASISGSMLLARALQRHEPWNVFGAPGILREIAPLAIWSTAGAVVHWSFNQGYSYVVAGTLDITAVAAISATRLLMMPINLLSTGIGSLMLPLAANWLHHHGAATTLRRLALFSGGLAVATIFYFVLMWLIRDWVFVGILKKQFAQRDQLLLFWGAIAIVSVVRDQLIFLPVARQRFRILTALALASATIALITAYWGMLRFGVFGALVGVLAGELVNMFGLVLLSFREVRRDRGASTSANDAHTSV